MTRPRPLVSVCIPTFNRPAALAQVVHDILDQSYPHIDIVVTDDGDEGETRAHLAPVLDRVRYHPNGRRLGIYGNWNRAIELARGELIAVYHDHDRYQPTIVERSVDLFLRSDRVGIVHVATEAHYSDTGVTLRPTHPELPEIAEGRWFAELQAWRWPSFVAHGCMMVRADLYRRLGTFDETKGLAADMDMLIRFAIECDVGFVREFLYQYSGRTSSDPLYGFRWSDLEAYIPVRRRNFERVYAAQPDKLSRALSALQRQVDRRLLRSMISLALHGRSSELRAGWDVMARHGSRAAYLAAQLAFSERPALRSARNLAFTGWRWRKARAGHAVARQPDPTTPSVEKGNSP